jgi:acyl-CoA thioesterase-2
VTQPPLDLSRAFDLEPHGPDTYVGESPPYPWGRIYGGLVVAQALWAATQTVKTEHAVHSLHAYFILGGDLKEPVRYEVDRVRNGRSFTTRRVVARQSAGAILTLACSFQVDEGGPESQSAAFPDDVKRPEQLTSELDGGVEIRPLRSPPHPPRSRLWARYPEPLGDDTRLHACGLAYVSDVNPMGAVTRSHPRFQEPREDDGWGEEFMGASLDHSVWFHRPVRADDWMLVDMTGHGLIGSRGLATGPVFDHAGVHVATVAQEGLLRVRSKS